MVVKVEKKDKNIVELEIEVEAAKFEEAVQKAYQKNSQKFSVPGFRRGKAPRNIIERYYGKEVFYEDAINIACADAYDKAIEENDIFPVDRPNINIKKVGEGENLVFTASVTVKPEVELGEYKGVEVEKIEVNITDEDVEKELKAVAEKNARIMSVEDRGIQKGDLADIDFEGFIDGEPFEGGKASGYVLEIGSGTFIDGFEDQLIGGRPGDDIEVNVTFPEDYGKEELAGKPALFKVIVNDVKVKELPEIDDEFAKDVSEFDTLEEYKESIRKKLTEGAEHKAKHELEDKVIAKVMENAQVDIPEVMIERQIDSIVRDYNMRLSYQGLDLDKYLMIMGIDYDTFRSQLRDRAHDDIKRQLVLEKVAKVEDMKVSDEEFDEETEKIAKSYNMEQEDFKKHLRDDDIEYIKATILFKKAVDFLVQSAKIL
ncbi:MAG TPA: trigger factor [Acetivibrio sp.]|uniref:trigger factor n=1 Tax=Acetivibrio sp. TaxID=1872092 RepID=UPI002BAB16CE|nr:trigger factor [Acetivibrio sp.]HOM02763.1 trigger factor [Acetivibrio sp.]